MKTIFNPLSISNLNKIKHYLKQSVYLGLICLGTMGLGSCDDVTIGGRSVQPFAPNITWGGRAVAVSVHPTNSAFMIAASESGGIFTSDTGGLRWVAKANNSRFWSYAVSDIDYSPFDSRYIIATTHVDLNTTANGGIWISSNGALSFQRPTNFSPPTGPRCAVQNGAYGISFDPRLNRVYVGTDCGYAWSDDSGQSWSHNVIDTTLPVNGDKSQDRVLNIVGRGDQLYALTSMGAYYSTNGGSNWLKSAGLCTDRIPHKSGAARLAIFSNDPDHALLTLEVCTEDDPDSDDDKRLVKLYFTEDSGATWEEIRSVNDSSREGFVRITRINFENPQRGGHSIYWGKGSRMERATLGDVSGAFFRDLIWQDVNTDHADINDLAFDGTTDQPKLLATDGGLHLTDNDGQNWSITGSGFNGYQALQIYDVAGQFKYDDDGNYEGTDLYFGTHDNDLWHSKDGGSVWENKGDPEGAGLNLMRSVNNYDNTRIAGFKCAPCARFMTKEHFSDNKIWIDAPHEAFSIPMVITGKEFSQFSRDTIAGSVDLFYSDDEDDNWLKVKSLDKNFYGLPQLSKASNDWLTFGVEEGTRLADGTRFITLRSISSIQSPTDAQLYSGDNSFGGLGVRGYQFVWTPVFGVSPDQPNHIIAPDIVSEKVRYTIDGGVTWDDDDVLTDLINESGTYDFYERRRLMVTEISFQPDNPHHILVGTRINGIFITDDGGLSWEKFPGSQQIPHVTSFFWDTPNNQVIVSSFGRGLWRLTFGDNYLESTPDEIRTPKPIDPDRAAISPISNPIDMTITGMTMMNGMAMLRTGQELQLTGRGFLENTNTQGPVEIMIDGELETRAFPTSNGEFSASIQINRTDGDYTITAFQKIPTGKIEVSRSVVIFNNSEEEDN